MAMIPSPLGIKSNNLYEFTIHIYRHGGRIMVRVADDIKYKNITIDSTVFTDLEGQLDELFHHAKNAVLEIHKIESTPQGLGLFDKK